MNFILLFAFTVTAVTLSANIYKFIGKKPIRSIQNPLEMGISKTQELLDIYLSAILCFLSLIPLLFNLGVFINKKCDHFKIFMINLNRFIRMDSFDSFYHKCCQEGKWYFCNNGFEGEPYRLDKTYQVLGERNFSTGYHIEEIPQETFPTEISFNRKCKIKMIDELETFLLCTIGDKYQDLINSIFDKGEVVDIGLKMGKLTLNSLKPIIGSKPVEVLSKDFKITGETVQIIDNFFGTENTFINKIFTYLNLRIYVYRDSLSIGFIGSSIDFHVIKHKLNLKQLLLFLNIVKNCDESDMRIVSNSLKYKRYIKGHIFSVQEILKMIRKGKDIVFLRPFGQILENVVFEGSDEDCEIELDNLKPFLIEKINEKQFYLSYANKVIERFGDKLGGFLIDYTLDFFGFENNAALNFISQRDSCARYRDIGFNWKAKRYFSDINYIFEKSKVPLMTKFDKSVPPSRKIINMSEEIPYCEKIVKRNIVKFNMNEEISTLESEILKNKKDKRGKGRESKLKSNLILLKSLKNIRNKEIAPIKINSAKNLGIEILEFNPGENKISITQNRDYGEFLVNCPINCDPDKKKKKCDRLKPLKVYSEFLKGKKTEISNENFVLKYSEVLKMNPPKRGEEKEKEEKQMKYMGKRNEILNKINFSSIKKVEKLADLYNNLKKSSGNEKEKLKEVMKEVEGIKNKIEKCETNKEKHFTVEGNDRLFELGRKGSKKFLVQENKIHVQNYYDVLNKYVDEIENIDEVKVKKSEVSDVIDHTFSPNLGFGKNLYNIMCFFKNPSLKVQERWLKGRKYSVKNFYLSPDLIKNEFKKGLMEAETKNNILKIEELNIKKKRGPIIMRRKEKKEEEEQKNEREKAGEKEEEREKRKDEEKDKGKEEEEKGKEEKGEKLQGEKGEEEDEKKKKKKEKEEIKKRKKEESKERKREEKRIAKEEKERRNFLKKSKERDEDDEDFVGKSMGLKLFEAFYIQPQKQRIKAEEERKEKRKKEEEEEERRGKGNETNIRKRKRKREDEQTMRFVKKFRSTYKRPKSGEVLINLNFKQLL